MLYEKPFNKISVIDILTEADVSKGTFYKYFQDKYELAKELIENYFSQLERSVLFKTLAQYKEQYVTFFNATRFQYMAIRKINDEFLDGTQYLKNKIRNSYIKQTKCSDVEADLFANQTLWTFDYLSSLKKNISKETLDSLFFSIERVMTLARS